MAEMLRQLKGGASRRAAKIERFAGGFVAHRRDGDSGKCAREVRHAEVFVAVMKFSVLGDQSVGFVVRCRYADQCLANDVAEAGVLEKMTAKGVARFRQRFVAAGDP